MARSSGVLPADQDGAGLGAFGGLLVDGGHGLLDVGVVLDDLVGDAPGVEDGLEEGGGGVFTRAAAFVASVADECHQWKLHIEPEAADGIAGLEETGVLDAD